MENSSSSRFSGERTGSAGRRVVSDIRAKRSSINALTEANCSLASTIRPALLKRSSSWRGQGLRVQESGWPIPSRGARAHGRLTIAMIDPVLDTLELTGCLVQEELDELPQENRIAAGLLEGEVEVEVEVETGVVF